MCSDTDLCAVMNKILYVNQCKSPEEDIRLQS